MVAAEEQHERRRKVVVVVEVLEMAADEARENGKREDEMKTGLLVSGPMRRPYRLLRVLRAARGAWPDWLELGIDTAPSCNAGK